MIHEANDRLDGRHAGRRWAMSAATTPTLADGAPGAHVRPSWSRPQARPVVASRGDGAPVPVVCDRGTAGTVHTTGGVRRWP